MGKAKQITHVSKCQCNVCGQVAFVVPGVEHHHCHGIKLLPGKTLPVLFSGLRHPTVRGTWEMWVPPVEKTDDELAALAMSGGEMPEARASHLAPSAPDPAN